MERTWTLVGPESTARLGRSLGETAPVGAVLALTGDLGAGKTSLAQGVGAGLGVRGPITSPTFTLMWVHEDGRLPFVHADFYRLGDESELVELGLEEWLGVVGVAVVEWAERFEDALPADRLVGVLEHRGPDSRTCALRATGPVAAGWLAGLP